VTESVVQHKYVTVNIPTKLFLRIEKIIRRNNDFKTVADYVTFVIREVVIEHSNDSVELFTSDDLEMLKRHLTALGSLDDDIR